MGYLVFFSNFRVNNKKFDRGHDGMTEAMMSTIVNTNLINTERIDDDFSKESANKRKHSLNNSSSEIDNKEKSTKEAEESESNAKKSRQYNSRKKPFIKHKQRYKSRNQTEKGAY